MSSLYSLSDSSLCICHKSQINSRIDNSNRSMSKDTIDFLIVEKWTRLALVQVEGEQPVMFVEG